MGASQEGVYIGGYRGLRVGRFTQGKVYRAEFAGDSMESLPGGRVYRVYGGVS